MSPPHRPPTSVLHFTNVRYADKFLTMHRCQVHRRHPSPALRRPVHSPVRPLNPVSQSLWLPSGAAKCRDGANPIDRRSVIP